MAATLGIARKRVYSTGRPLGRAIQERWGIMARHIGVDLHRDRFNTAVLAENGRCYHRQWRLSELERFAGSLRPDDQVAVEMTENARLFHDRVSPRVERVAVVNTRQFRVIAESVKKTDRRDAETLARYLAKDMLPTVHVKDRETERLASLTRSRDALVKQRTAMKNMVGSLFAAAGRSLPRERLSSARALDAVEREAEARLHRLEALEAKVFLRQIRNLDAEVAGLEAVIKEEGAKLKGFKELTSIKGIGALSATILLTVIDGVERFPREGKLSAYLGLVPRVSDSGTKEHRGRITKAGSKLGRTTLVQCALIAKKYSPFLFSYHERLKRKKGSGKANVALARKFLGIIYRTLRNGWVFADFPAFRLEDGTVPLWRGENYVAPRRDLSPGPKPEPEGKEKGGAKPPLRGRQNRNLGPQVENFPPTLEPAGARVASPRCPILHRSKDLSAN
ncbi:MAG: IS110 family transposase [Planctomycetota bacterium]|jgi:transposase|nr:IS110 family transposase [Planctomycetota bacterium]